MRLSDADFQSVVAEARARHNMSDIAGRHTALKRRGPREMVGLCPFHEERTPSFEVNDDKGTYQCHGCGAGGDAITFLIQLEGLSFMKAVETLSGSAFPVVSVTERAKRKRASEQEIADRIALARSIWAQTRPIADTPAEVYLHSRKINIVPPASVRFVLTPRWRNPETGEVGKNVPALACALQNRTGSIVGVQCVFLDDGGRKKYERQRPDGSAAKAKLSFGIIAGSALRLGPVTNQVVITEGPEDGLTLLQQLGDRSIWVSCGTAMMSRMDLPADVSEVILAGDNNDGGRKAVDEAEAAYLSQGLAVSSIYPDQSFKDWNDELRGIHA